MDNIAGIRNKPDGAPGLLVALLLFQVLLTAAHASQYSIPGVRLVGRFVVQGSHATFEWPGSTIEIAFEGTRLEVELDDTGANSMVVDIDGVTTRIDLQQGRHTYPIIVSEAAGQHLVRLVRRTESRFGPTILRSIRADGPLLPPPARKHSLLVIGDSIAAGYGVEGKDTSCSFSPDTENQYLTYAAMAGRRLDADVVTLASSGRGLVRNYDGSTHGTMGDLYGRPRPSQPAVEPLPATDIVVIHLGTNDFGGGARPADFATRYSDLLAHLRGINPTAMIYAAAGPLLGGDDHTALLAAIDEAIALRKAHGDDNLTRLVFTDPPDTPSRGCDWHPNVAGQQFMAEQLAMQITQDLGWMELK